MFHIMVRSYDGYQRITEGWRRREVWSTFDTDSSYTIALLTKFQLEAGGVAVQVVPDHQYADFCLWHKVA